MADVNANIGVNIDTSEALSQLKALQRQISQFHTSISRSSEAAALAQRDLQRNFINSVNSIGAFSAELRTIKTTAESFTDSLEKNKFSMREYFRYAGGATKTFSRLFKSEFDTVNKVAEENVKRLQTQYIKMGRDASGAMRAIAIIPNELDMSKMSTQMQIASQRQAIFNQLIKQGSTNLLNFGKNTQWAGRQLMVGFTLPLASLGAVASRTFMDMETAALKFRKVYGDLFTPTAEREQALADIQALGESFTRYGIAVSQTVNLAADAAAAGFQGLDLQRQVTEATRLQVLGQIDQQKALETTISLQSAFQLSNEDLTDSINFLNAVENQTVVSLDDITTAIPKVAPVIMQLGGSVKDLAFFLTAMKEGGVNASEGANALKSGLAALINPTAKAAAMLADMGINIKNIVEKNKGDLRATVIDFAKALDTLDPLTRARAIEQLFGKFQFARLSTLFENVTRGGNQAARVLDLAGYSASELAKTAESELGMTADSAMNKFRKTVEDLKLALVPVGQTFLEAMTPIVEFIGNILEKFNDLPKGVKKALTIVTIAIGAIGPVALMTFGLLANALANGIKFIEILRKGYLRLTGQSKVLGEQTQYLTVEQQNALAVAHSLDQSHAKLIQTFTVENTAVRKLAQAYQSAMRAGMSFATLNPGMMKGKLPGFKSGIISVPGTGTEDKYPAMLAAGEAVIPAKQNKKYASLIQGIIADNIPGFRKGQYGSGSSGRIGKSGVTVPIPYKANVSSVGGAINFLDINPQDIVNISSIYTKQIADTAKVSIAQINREIANWKMANINAIRQATNLVNQGVSAEVAFGPLIDKFEKDMTDLGGATSRFAATAKAKMPELQKDLIQAQTKAKELGLNVKNAADATRLAGQLPNNIVAQGMATPGRFSALARARQGSAAMLGGTSGIGQYGIPRFMLPTALDPKTAAYGLGSSQEHFSTTVQQEQNLKTQKELRAQAKANVDATIRETQIAAKTASPSRRTIPIGEDIARGLEVGMQNRQDDVQRAGQNLTNAAVAGTQSRQRRVATSPGGQVGAGGIIIPPIIPPTGGGGGGPQGPMYGPRKPTRFDRTFGSAAGKFRSVGAKFGAGGYSNAGFAASMAVSAAAMAPGKIGQAAQTAMPVVFGLQALQMALKLPIPHIKAFAAVALAGVAVFKLVNAAREKERMSIEGLADAATLSADKLKTLGDFFGVTTTKTPFQTDLPQIVATPEKRSQLEQLKASEGFQKTFAKDIQTLQKATAKEAEVVFKSLAVSLKGQGFAEEQIQNIVDALREEAGKTDVNIDVKSLNLKTKEGQAALQQSVDDIVNNVNTAFKTGFEKKTVLTGGVGPSGQYYSQWVEQLVPTKELKKQTKAAGAEISSFINGISGQLRNGTIGAKEFTQSFNTIEKTITAMNATNPQAAMMIMANVMATLPEKARKAAEGVKTLDGQMLLLKMQALGLTSNLAGVADALKILQNPLSDVSDRIKAQKTVDDAIKQTIEYAKKLEEQLKKAMGGGLTGGNTAESAFAKLKKQLLENITNTQNGITAFNKMRQAGIGISEALELSKDPLVAMVLATEKNKKRFNEILNLIRLMNKEADKDTLTRYLEGLKAGTDLKQAFLEIMPLLEQMGLSTEEIMNLMNNQEVAQSLIDGLSKATDKAAYLKQYIDAIVKDRVVNIKINVSTVQGAVQQVTGAASAAIKSIDARAAIITRAAQTGDYGGDFAKLSGLTAEQISALSKVNISASEAALKKAQDAAKVQQGVVDGIQKGIAAKQHEIDLNNLSIQKQQDFIDGIDESINKQQDLLKTKEKYVDITFDTPLQALQDESSVLSNSLTQIDYQAKSINEKYDAQQRALEEMNKLNEESIQQGKTKLGIADALSRGDVSAAAQAAQELRSQQAAAQAGAAQSALAAGREAALAGISVNGMTRAQIEERQYQIGQQSFRIEQQKALYIKQNILPIQQEIARLEESKIPFQNEINRLTKINDGIQKSIATTQATTLYNAQASLDVANDAVDAANDKLDADKASLKAIIDALTEGGKTKSQWESITEQAEAALSKFEAIKNALVAGENAAKEIERILKDINGKVYTAKVNVEQTGVTTTDAIKAATNTASLNTAVNDAVKANVATAGQIANAMASSLINQGVDPSLAASSARYTGQAIQYYQDINKKLSNVGADSLYDKRTGYVAKMYGGKIKKMAMGGMVGGTGMTDKVPAMLTPGEFVVNKQAAKQFGGLLEFINSSKYPQMLANGGMAGGGSASYSRPSFGSLKNSLSAPSYSSGGRSMPSMSKAGGAMPIISDNSNTVYNYNVGITLSGTNMNPNTVAKAVMDEIRYVDSQRIRGQRA